MPGHVRIGDLTVGVCSHGLPCCLAKDTIIYTDSGPIQIQNYESSMRLWSSVGWQKPLHFHAHEYKGKLIAIKLRGMNDHLLLTPDHLLYTSSYRQCPIKGGGRRCYPECVRWDNCDHIARNDFVNYHWEEAANISERDYCIFPIDEQLNSGTLEISDIDPMWYLFGVWFAEGCFDNSKNPHELQLSITETNTELIDRLRVIIEDLGYVFRIYTRANKGCVSIRVTCVELCAVISSLFNHGAIYKSIPSCILTYSKKEIKSFLRGWFDGDGWTDPSNYYIDTSSRNAAYMGQFLLWMIGIPASLGQYKNHKPKRYNCDPCHDRYHIGWAKRKSKTIKYDNKLFIYVSSVQEIEYDGYVYNFTMDKDTQLPEFSIPILSHNCPHG